MAGYDTYQAFTDVHGLGRDPNPVSGYDYGLSTQRHVDVRTFIEGGWSATSLSPPGPPPPTITTGSQVAYNKWPGASLTLAHGTTARYTSAYTTPLDLLQLGTTGLLTITLPDLTGGQLDLANSAIELSSDSFASVLSIPWSSSTVDPIANHYLSFPLALTTTIDLSAVNGVRLVVRATLDTIFTVMAIRVIDPRWVALNVDFENISGRLRQTIPLDGNPLTIPDSSHTLPLLWFASDLPGIDDPRPINSEYGFVINTGSQTHVNTFSLFMREATEAFTTQIDLQGTPQNVLTNHPQPIVSPTSKMPRPMADLDRYTMTQLGNNSMTNLEAVSNPAYSSWIRFAVTWGVAPIVQITNSTNLTGGFQYSNVTFANNTSYLVVCSLNESTARLQLYNVNQTTLAMEDLIFDTMSIPDAFLFPRRAGRVGLQALIHDGDAYVGAIRPRSLMFAEYRSAPLRSITPVKGARLYAQSTPPIELFRTWLPLSDGDLKLPTLITDQQRYISGSDTFSTKVTVVNPSTVAPPQGIVSNVLSSDTWSGITDFGELHVEFYVWIPSAAIMKGVNGPSVLTAQLVSLAQSNTLDYAEAGLFGGAPLIMPVIKPDQWQKISVYRPVPKPYPVSGPYRLALFYHGKTSAVWWVDGVSVHEHVVQWDARSVVDDPWLSNDAPWTGFHENINSDINGAHFTTQGTELQLRGQARQQAVAIIGSPKIVPQYAELGKLVWDEDSIVMPALPTATITASFVGRTYSFGVTGVSSGVGSYQWSFGDDAFAAGPVVSHTYSAAFTAGTQFTVYLTLYDQMGQTNSVSDLITLA